MPESSRIVVDFGTGNNRRLINVTDISRELEKKEDGLGKALLAFYAVTGCDFNSATQHCTGKEYLNICYLE